MMSMIFARTLVGATLLVGACNPNPRPAVIQDIRLTDMCGLSRGRSCSKKSRKS